MTAAVRPRRRRWVRVVTPFLALALVGTVTLIAHADQTPDLGDPGTLSPLGEGADGSSRLAARLQAAGVAVERVTGAEAAMVATGRADTTVFVPTPDFVNPRFVDRVAAAPGRHRVVVVEPGLLTTLLWSVPIGRTASARWATGVIEPDCTDPTATQAGRAALARVRYLADAATTRACYRGGLVGIQVRQTEVIVVGASDPFRNGRIDEHGNEALAIGLLTGYPRVVWVDVHRIEPRIRTEVNLPLPQYRRPTRSRGDDGGSPLWGAFPAWLWAALALAAGVAVLFAVGQARRLGPPVAEPLPVLVPAAETVTGRGRLYHRIRARPATLEALRAATRARLATVVSPTGPISTEELTSRLAQQLDRPESEVRAALFDPVPDTDADLVAAVARLDALRDAVLRGCPT
ncbi:MAG: DUF4350 domain-containing protein [Micromonosporaceae bacterium]